MTVKHKKPYKSYEGKTKDVLIAFIGYVNDLNKLQHFTASVQKSHHRLQYTTVLSIMLLLMFRNNTVPPPSWRKLLKTDMF